MCDIPVGLLKRLCFFLCLFNLYGYIRVGLGLMGVGPLDIVVFSK